MNVIDGLLNEIDLLKKRIEDLRTQSTPRWVMLTAPLTSTSWDGDTYSTTAKTKIDLSSVFSAPAGMKAVLVRLAAKDTGSAAGTNIYIELGPTNTSDVSPLWCILDGITNSHYHDTDGIVPCDANGDIYYQISASGAGSMTPIIQIWGYLI